MMGVPFNIAMYDLLWLLFDIFDWRHKDATLIGCKPQSPINLTATV